MDQTLVIKDITSGNVDRIRDASCKIIYAGQKRDELKPLIPYIEQIRTATQDIAMGGMFAPNKRFPEFAIKTLEFHRDSLECTCRLYVGGYDSFDPDDEARAGNIDIVSTSRDNYSIVVRCKKCDRVFNIDVLNGHWVFYKWTMLPE